MKVVFSNIISNAIQAIGERDGNIIIRTSEAKHNIVLEFEDSGLGILPKDLPRIFDPLFTTKQTGTGLGLVSCKTVIEQHGGKIEAKNAKNGGAIFIVTLPKNLSSNI